MRLFELLSASCFVVAGVALAQTPPAPPFTLNPASGLRGKSYLLTVKASGDCETKKTLKGAKLLSTLGDPDYKVQDQSCILAAQLAIPGDAPYNDVDVLIKLSDGTVAPLKFKVTDVTPGPVFPGIDEKDRVDVTWKVLPRRVVSDSFGVRVAKLYYGIEVVIGNDSGYDLQVASMNFRLPGVLGLDSPVPTDAYRIVRGSLEQAQQVGLRNTAINIIKGMGPVLTGANFFFFNTGHQARYNGLVGIFSNPFEKGLEMIFPDLTVRQLAALDNQTLRDGTIIPNNVQQRVLVFISRDTLMRNRDEYFRLLAADRKQQACAGIEAAKRAGKADVASEMQRRCEAEIGRAAKELRSSLDSSADRFWGLGQHEFDPQEVMRQLGELVIVGRSIQYVNRVSIVANKSNIGVPIPPVANRPSPDEAWAGNDITIQVTGNGLDGAQLTSEVAGVSISERNIGPGGTTASWKLSIGPKVEPGQVILKLVTPGGGTSLPFTIKAPPKVAAPAAVTLGRTGTRKLALIGTDLNLIENASATPSAGITLALADRAPGGGRANLTIVAKDANPGDYEVSFTAKDGSKLPIPPVKFTVVAAPTFDASPKSGAAGAATTVKLTGKALDALGDVSAAGGLSIKKGTVSDDGTAMDLTVTVPAGTKAGDYDVTFANGPKFTFTVK